jgi:hypothetical protein
MAERPICSTFPSTVAWAVKCIPRLILRPTNRGGNTARYQIECYSSIVSQPVALIQEIAKAIGGRVQTSNLFDANVSQRSPVIQESWELIAPPGEFFRHKVNITVRGRKVTLRANGAFVVAEVRSNLDVAPTSINRRDKIWCLSESSLRVPTIPSLPVFASTSDSLLAHFLSSTPLAEALLALRLGDAESLHIYRNGVNVYLQPESAQELLSAVEAVCKLVEQLPEYSEPHEADDSLPQDLTDLSPVIQEWAIPDDELRTEMLEQKTPEALRGFIATVESRAVLIEKCIGSLASESESAIALNTLLECAAEARLMLLRLLPHAT